MPSAAKPSGAPGACSSVVIWSRSPATATGDDKLANSYSHQPTLPGADPFVILSPERLGRQVSAGSGGVKKGAPPERYQLGIGRGIGRHRGGGLRHPIDGYRRVVAIVFS